MFFRLFFLSIFLDYSLFKMLINNQILYCKVNRDSSNIFVYLNVLLKKQNLFLIKQEKGWNIVFEILQMWNILYFWLYILIVLTAKPVHVVVFNLFSLSPALLQQEAQRSEWGTSRSRDSVFWKRAFRYLFFFSFFF